MRSSAVRLSLQKADMWSLGVLLFTMLTGQDPFSAQKMSATTGTSYVRSLLMVSNLLIYIFDS